MAGAPSEVMDVFAYKHQKEHTWDTTKYAKAGGTYELKAGDLIHFDYGHYAMVVDVDYDETADTLEIKSWNGNPDVSLDVHKFKRASDALYEVNDKINNFT